MSTPSAHATAVTSLFSCPLGDDAALIPRTADLAEAFQALLEDNHRRLSHWFPDAFQEPPIPAATRASLEEDGRAWCEGSRLPMALVAQTPDGRRLAGWVNLLIDAPARSGEVGYWLGAGFEGRGLAARAVTAVLDHAFGPLGLDRVALQATADNMRSRGVAERLGFTQEGVLREAAAFPGERRDVVLYGLLSREWHASAR
ncbi:MAG TPA: GNAT family protein [Streptomyces sp.]|nr:GNAT family protein [Streptomyces sp.]